MRPIAAPVPSPGRSPSPAAMADRQDLNHRHRRHRPSTTSETAPLASPSRQAAPLGPEHHAGHRGIPAVNLLASRRRHHRPPHPRHWSGRFRRPFWTRWRLCCRQILRHRPVLRHRPHPRLPLRSHQSPPRNGGDDWAVLAAQDADPGGEPVHDRGRAGGRVVFSCLIPLAGRQAVTQRFEAEGDDVVRSGASRVAAGRALAGHPARRHEAR